MSTPKSEKMMSSRLMNMKFMQRASSSSSKAASNSDSPSPAKRQRTGGDSSLSSTISKGPEQDAALDTFELKRRRALERQGREHGETKWVLKHKDNRPSQYSTTRLNVKTAGYSLIDSAQDAEQEASADDDKQTSPKLSGRITFGNFRQPALANVNTGVDEASTDEDEKSEGDSGIERGEDVDSPHGSSTPANPLSRSADVARAGLRAKRKAKQAEALQLAERRRSKEVKLSRLTSISSHGGTAKPTSSNIQCFKCGKLGHTKKQCPR